MTTLKYKNYIATIEVDCTEEIVIGHVHGLKDKISFHTEYLAKIKEEFHTAVDDYLAFCEELGEQPEKPFSGSILFRTTPAIHREVALAALESEKSQAQFIEDAVVHFLHRSSECNRCQKATVQGITLIARTVDLLDTQLRQVDITGWQGQQDVHKLGVYRNG